jgi:hypothetical protein
LSGPGQLSEAIAHEDCARYFFAVQVAGMRQDGSHSSVQVVATDDGRVPDPDTSHIGDRIQRASRQDTNLQPQVSASGSRLGSGVLRDRDQQEEQGGCENLLGHRTGL